MPRLTHRSTERLRVVVLGYIVRGPLGGLAWHHLQYLMGLAALGHDVWFVENGDDWPSCYDPSRQVMDADPTYGLGFTASTLASIGMDDRWAYWDAHTSTWHGPGAAVVERICQSADVVLNISAVNPLRPWVEDVPVRVLIDTDPVFTQVRHLTNEADRRTAEAHTAFFTYAANFGEPGCEVPDDGLPWRPTRQPVVLEAWADVDPPPAACFTTVMQWDSYPVREYAGRRYGMKSASFEPYLALPQSSRARLELALGNVTGPQRERLRAAGWVVRDSVAVTLDCGTYQRYLQGSLAEWSVAKHGYVVSRSGWFSERSANYLASGRPVVTQDTAFGDWLPTGAGLLAFDDAGTALAAIDEVLTRYDFHRRSARSLVAEHFDADRVIGDLLAAATADPA